jgi:hypothetical protein
MVHGLLVEIHKNQVYWIEMKHFITFTLIINVNAPCRVEMDGGRHTDSKTVHCCEM